MTELKDSLKYFLVFLGTVKHYKTILVVETVVHLKDCVQKVNSIVCYFPSEQKDILC